MPSIDRGNGSTPVRNMRRQVQCHPGLSAFQKDIQRVRREKSGHSGKGGVYRCLHYVARQESRRSRRGGPSKHVWRYRHRFGQCPARRNGNVRKREYGAEAHALRTSSRLLPKARWKEYCQSNSHDTICADDV